MNSRESIIHNPVTDAVLTRQTVRSYEPEELTEEQLATLLECALRAPSGRNSQPCLVRVMRKKENLDALNRDFKDTVGWDTPAYTRWDVNPVYQTAPCMFFIFSETDSGINSGIMAENIAIAAKGLGLDSCIIASVGALFDGEFAGKWKSFFHVSEKAKFMIAIAVGKGCETPEIKPRNRENLMLVD